MVYRMTVPAVLCFEVVADSEEEARLKADVFCEQAGDRLGVIEDEKHDCDSRVYIVGDEPPEIVNTFVVGEDGVVDEPGSTLPGGTGDERK